MHKPPNKYNLSDDQYFTNAFNPSQNYYQSSQGQSNTYWRKNNNNKYNSNYNNNYNNYTNQPFSKNPNKSKDKVNSYYEKINPARMTTSEQTKSLINELIENTLECMICNEVVKKEAAIWHCETCWTIFHLKCANEWITKLNSDKRNLKEFKWTCPHCNAQYASEEMPSYDCFCKKYYKSQNNKHFDPSLIPHGCGLLCNKEICKHIRRCPLPCHPGPHVACMMIETVNCFCAKNSKQLPCTYDLITGYSCEEICGKQLACGKALHTCKALCHEGSCSQFLKNEKCYECIAESKEKLLVFLKELEDKLRRECYEAEHLTSFSSSITNFIFTGELPCKDHFYNINTDQNLKLLLRIFEMSGGSIVENLKTFIPICQEKVDNKCNCSNMVSTTDCYKLNYPEDLLDFLGIVKEEQLEKCTKICKSLKNCKSHRCERICCELRDKAITNYSIQDPLGHHLCLIQCGKTLACNRHKCENYCHKGPCKPCAYIIHEGVIQCSCGKTKKDPPYICNTKVECLYPCTQSRKCEHECSLTTCHYGPCPPCEELTFKNCRCSKNIISNVECSNTSVQECQVICEAMLSCGVHFCDIRCHLHTEEYDKEYHCSLKCNRALMSCSHLCQCTCHGEIECNEFACEGSASLLCKCRTITKPIKCGELKRLLQVTPDFCLSCGDECIKAERLRNIESAFEGLAKISEEKMKLLYPNCSIDGSEEPKKEKPLKYDPETIKMAQEKIKELMQFETVLYQEAEKYYEEQVPDKEVKIPVDKGNYYNFCEWLVFYHMITPQKTKNQGQKEIVFNMKNYQRQKYRLSLIALLLKYNLFAGKRKLAVYHPFKYTMLIINNRFNMKFEGIEACLMNLGKLKWHDYYLVEKAQGEFYVHFFDAALGKRIYQQCKIKQHEFQEVFEIEYRKQTDTTTTSTITSEDDEEMNKMMYSYLDNEQYLSFLNEGTNSIYYQENKKEKEEIDDDGFMKVTTSKKKGKPYKK